MHINNQIFPLGLEIASAVNDTDPEKAYEFFQILVKFAFVIIGVDTINIWFNSRFLFSTKSPHCEHVIIIIGMIYVKIEISEIN
jgi:uncharacterized membrane protein AbrB (regulator of aidB expression)